MFIVSLNRGGRGKGEVAITHEGVGAMTHEGVGA